jgi:T-complex protein 1 subunit eta
LNAFITGEGAPYGVDINTGGIADSFSNFVWEPSVVKVLVYLQQFDYEY